MEVKLEWAKLQKMGLAIGIPCFGGMISSQTFISCINLANEFQEHGIPLRFMIISNESLVTRARQNIAKMFLDSTEYTHLMFIDADIGFQAEDVITLLALAAKPEYGLIGGSYPKKAIDWTAISHAVKLGVEESKLEQCINNPVINFLPDQKTIKLDEPIEVLELATGFMMIRRDVFEKIQESTPEDYYIPDYTLSNELFDDVENHKVHNFFDVRIVTDETSTEKANAKVKRMLSEDYSFCKKWRDIGGSVWLAPWINLNHVGTYTFQGNLSATMVLQSKWIAATEKEKQTNGVV